MEYDLSYIASYLDLDYNTIVKCKINLFLSSE